MITVEEARSILAQHRPEPRVALSALINAHGHVLAESLISPVNVPPFDNSAMDGYAFHFESWQGRALVIAGESAAGQAVEKVLPEGTAMRIFTGAPVPSGADTVVMQEKTRIENQLLYIEDPGLKPGANVRKAGSQTVSGQTLLNAHTFLSAGAMGFLAGCGISEVAVYKRPEVSVVVTGDEIVPPGTDAASGKIYESNSYSLTGALASMGICPQVSFCSDTESEIYTAIEKALSNSDLILITGGVSAGDYDFVVPALKNLGVEQLFHKVKQKPAKPLYAGLYGEQAVFGLPGNPASVLTSFYVYVAPWIRRFCGLKESTVYAVLEEDYEGKAGLTRFLKGYAAEGQVRVLNGQESYRMDTFAQANCLIEIPENSEKIKAGEPVRLIMF